LSPRCAGQRRHLKKILDDVLLLHVRQGAVEDGDGLFPTAEVGGRVLVQEAQGLDPLRDIDQTIIGRAIGPAVAISGSRILVFLTT
jgi:hypothetical protein